MYRSTKGASKARRDQINAEIRNLRDLLPISEAERARLSYLHIMSLACMYTRKSVFFSQGESAPPPPLDHGSLVLQLAELVHTLPGFLLLLTSEGKLIYLSDNVAEHLGHSMVDLVAQSDSVYDIIDPADHFIMRNNLVPMTTPDTDRLFRCRFSTSKFMRRQGGGSRLTLVRARCLSPPCPAPSYRSSNPVWVCLCAPLESPPTALSPPTNPLPTPPTEQAFLLACFQSWHSADMKLQDAQHSVSVYLGYEVEALRSRSWYSLLHPHDLPHASNQHCTLLREGGERQVEMVVRVESADHSWVWLYMVLCLQGGDTPIHCQNYIISESEAYSVRQQLYSDPSHLSLLYPLDPPTDALSSPAPVFTPSSGVSAQSFDFSFSSGRSSSEELPPSAGPSGVSYLPPDSQSFAQGWPGGSSQLSAAPLPAAPPSLTETVPCSQHPPPPAPTSRPPSLPSLQHRVAEFVCTPPYTPRVAGSSFLFGEEIFRSDHADPSVAGPGQKIPPLAPPMELGHGTLHEQLPPSPHSPGGGCTLMAVREIRGPLYVDVPLRLGPGPLEGLLTPEASPTNPPCPAFFPSQVEEREREREIEQLEISLLAQYISSLAETFCPAPPLPKRTPSPPPLPSPPPASKDHLLCENWKGLFPSLDPQEKASFEEGMLVDLPPQTCSSSPSSTSPSSPHSTPQCSPPVGGAWCPPTQSQGEEINPVGVHHFCSVHSTRSNLVGDGAPGVGLANEGEALAQSGLGVEVLGLHPPSAIPASPGANPVPALPVATQSLLEELVAMETVLEADASLAAALTQNTELYQLPHPELTQNLCSDGTGDHMF